MQTYSMAPLAAPTPVANTTCTIWRVEDAWRRLSEEQRLLLALHDIEGYTLVEIHSLTGLKDGTIKSRLHRARVRLGKLLQPETGVAPVADERGS